MMKVEAESIPEFLISVKRPTWFKIKNYQTWIAWAMVDTLDGS
jgi:hypothetical protein